MLSPPPPTAAARHRKTTTETSCPQSNTAGQEQRRIGISPRFRIGLLSLRKNGDSRIAILYAILPRNESRAGGCDFLPMRNERASLRPAQCPNGNRSRRWYCWPLAPARAAAN